jgi:two-component system sensor histidine kinase MprB
MERTSVSRRWADLPLRNRLAAMAAIPVALAIGVAVTVAYVETRHELRGQVDSQLRHQVVELQHQAADLQRQAQFQGTFGFPKLGFSGRAEFGQQNSYLQLVGSDGTVAEPPGQPGLPLTTHDHAVANGQVNGSFRDARVGLVSVRMLTAPLVDGYAVQVALPLTAVNGQLHRLAIAFTVLALAALAIAVFLAWWLTRRALTPVARLTEAAEQIAATKDLTHRIAEASGDELGRLAASFNSMLDALERSLTAQRQLIGDASHELRTPLASLRTNAEVLRDYDRLSLDERERVVTGIVSQVDELTALVADVVELARGDEPPQHIEPVAYDELVARATEQARRHWPALTFNLVAVPVTVHGVPQRLQRAVANLLDNAGKFSPAGGTVEVRLTSGGRLFVRDHGPGIAPDALPNVFERFYRADDARALPGSGLGLAIVKQVADSHGGAVTVHNADGGGVVAELTLSPVSDTSEAIPTTV